MRHPSLEGNSVSESKRSSCVCILGAVDGINGSKKVLAKPEEGREQHFWLARSGFFDSCDREPRTEVFYERFQKKNR